MSNLSLPDTTTIDSTYAAETASRVPLNLIRRNPNVDPRKGRNTERYASIRESIRSKGVFTPIMLRPIEGADVPYEVVFGNTRFDISVEVGNADIPARIQVMTDEQAREAAGIENMQRQDLTPIEEAKHCVIRLADCRNDHDEVCRSLGWSRVKLDSRILLSKCSDFVAEALVQGQIKIGHAELLAPMTEDDQRMVCTRIIEAKMSVADTKKRLQEISYTIAKARFDTSECNGCQHNSALYSDMFASALDSAKCQNATCWENKTAQLIEVRLIEAKQDYGTVHTDMTLPTNGYVLLNASGPEGVGSTQMTACMSCTNYGAVVSTMSGNEGSVVGGHCFDKKCHGLKVSTYKTVIAEANGEVPGTNTAGKTAATAPGATTPASAKSPSDAKSSPKPQEIKRSIRKEAFALFNLMGADAIQNNRSFVLAISIVSLYLDMRSDLPSELADKMRAAVGFPSTLASYNRAAFEVELAKRPIEELEGFLTRMAAASVFRKDVNDQFGSSVSGAQSLAFIQAASMNPVNHFVVNERYLKALTKSGVIADCQASGFSEQYDQANGDKAFSKLSSGKADELIKAVLEFKEFDWKGYLPETLKIEAHLPSGTV